MSTVLLPGFLYNIGAGRQQGQVAREIHAMLAFRARPSDPTVAELRLCEAIGYHPLPRVPGYRLFWDRTSMARANVATYIRDDLAGAHQWLDLKGTWPKTDHPGTHDPRSFLRTAVGRCVGFTAHQPPPFTRTEFPHLQKEGQHALVRALDPRRQATWDDRPALARQTALARPRWVSYDANATKDDPEPSPGTLARDVGGFVIGNRIDCVVARGEVTCREFEYVQKIRWRGQIVHLETDHNHALRYVLKVDERWTR